MKPAGTRETRVAELVHLGRAADFEATAFDAVFRQADSDAGQAAVWIALLAAWTGQRFPLEEALALGTGIRRAHAEMLASLGAPVSLQTALLHELHSRRGVLNDPQILSIGELEALRGGALADPDTGLYNRRFLEEHLDRELSRAERANAVFSIVLMEIPGLTQVATNLGAEHGSSLVASASKRIHDSLRLVDAGGRFEDDRFLALLPNTDMFHGIEVAERIRQNLSRTPLPGNGGLSVDYGVATFPLDGRTRSFLMKMADIRLYSSREATRAFTSARRHPRFLVSGMSLRLGAPRGESAAADIHDVSFGGLSFEYRGSKVPPLIEGDLTQRFSSDIHPVTLRRVSVSPSTGGRVRVNCAYAH